MGRMQRGIAQREGWNMVTNRRLQSTQPIPFRYDRLKGSENDWLGGKMIGWGSKGEKVEN